MNQHPTTNIVPYFEENRTGRILFFDEKPHINSGVIPGDTRSRFGLIIQLWFIINSIQNIEFFTFFFFYLFFSRLCFYYTLYIHQIKLIWTKIKLTPGKGAPIVFCSPFRIVDRIEI